MTAVHEPAIHLMCGLVGAGKSTLARQLARDLPAVRLSRDEWMLRLHGLPYDDPAYVERLGPCTDLLWDVALDVLSAGSSVVLDWNFWSVERRAEARDRARAGGFPIHVHWLDVPVETAIARARSRLADDPPDAHRLDDDSIRHFATIFEPPTDDEGLLLTRHD